MFSLHVVLSTTVLANLPFERPVMGWRNWNQFQANISQAIMQQQMRSLTIRRRQVWGLSRFSSLADVGYNRAVHASYLITDE
jgi:hypothetical protein